MTPEGINVTDQPKEAYEGMFLFPQVQSADLRTDPATTVAEARWVEEEVAVPFGAEELFGIVTLPTGQVQAPACGDRAATTIAANRSLVRMESSP